MCKFFEEELSVNVQACQQQSHRVDCGFYTVVNAFHLVSGVNISAKRICEDQSRRKSSTLSRKTIRFDALCSYIFPWVWYHKNKGLNMVQCDSCQNWYHQKCENMPDNVLNAKSSALLHCLDLKNNID